MIETITAKLSLSSLFATPIRRMLISTILLAGLLLGISQLVKQVAGNQIPLETRTGKHPINRLKQDGSLESLRKAIDDVHSPESSLQKAILIANDGAMDDAFGVSVAISGDTAIVGSYLDDIDNNSNQGSAYVFVRNGAIWALQQKLTVSNGAANDIFGVSVAISGNTILVGAPGRDIPSLADAGSVFVFVRNGTTWTEQQELNAAVPVVEGFGISVAINGETVVVGATTDSQPGSAYVFIRNGPTWSQQQHLTVPSAFSSAQIGKSVAIDGDTIVLGAPNDLISGFFLGSAYVFTRAGTIWTQQQQLLASDGQSGDLFGISVAIGGDTAVVGASGTGSNFGSAYVFTRNITTWTEQQKLNASDGANNDVFGISASISGESVVIGARGDSIGSASLRGSAYLFTRSGAVWAQQMKFLASDGSANDSFGWSADLDGASVLIGALGNDVATVANQGSAYVFDLNCAYSISPTSQNVAASGETGIITVTTGAGCSWTALSEASWISLAENGGTGNGTVNFLVTANTGAPRTGNIYVAGQIFTVSQDSGCVYNVTPVAQVFSENGGSGTINIFSNFGCLWTVTSNDNWISINGTGTGSGNGFPTYSVAAFGGGTRTGTITAAGETVTIIQTSGCEYAISPASQTVPGFGGSISVGVFTRPTCAWTAQSNDSWIVITSGANGIGDGTVHLSVNSTSSSSPRTGTVTIAGQTFTVFQQGNCSFTITPLNQVFGSEGANGMVNVSTQSGCQWTAQSNAAWVTITSGSTGSGSGSVGFTVVPNNGGSRTGLLNIAGQTVFINQTGRLVFYPLPYPVRLLDTRSGQTACNAPGMPIQGGTARTQFALAQCNGINFPSNASAITGNITAVNSGGGYLTVYPSDVARPLVANSNYSPNQVLNNVFTVGLSNVDHAFNIFVTTTTDVVVDITGYYAPPGAGGLYFHPLPKPVRLLETRTGFGGCFTPGAQLQAGSTTSQLGQTTCDGVQIPAGAQALVGNATTVGPQSNGFLTLFPANASRPLAASSNFQAGINMNAPFTVGLSPSGEFNIYTIATTDMVIDVLGYYSTQLNDINGQGLLFNSLPAPVRLLDTRANQQGCFTPGEQMTGGIVYTQSAVGACVNIPASAQAVVGNATTVNATANGFLTFWPSSALQPTVATSNFRTGQAFNRHFTVGLGPDGAFKRFSARTTDLVIDLSGYFSP